jgi:hypothetical protein
MEDIDFNSMDKDLVEIRDKFLLKVKNGAFTRVEFDRGRWCMDLALKQEFKDTAITRGTYTNYGLNINQVSNLSEQEIQDIETPNQPDEFSELYLPLMLKFFRAYLVNMSNLCFPANGDWLKICLLYTSPSPRD